MTPYCCECANPILAGRAALGAMNCDACADAWKRKAALGGSKVAIRRPPGAPARSQHLPARRMH